MKIQKIAFLFWGMWLFSLVGFCVVETPLQMDRSLSMEEEACQVPPASCQLQTTEDHCFYCMQRSWILQAEFLYWRSNLDGLNYADQGGSPFGFGQRIDLKKKCIEPEYEPGVRLGIGYDFGPSHWDVMAVWTYHYSNQTSSTRNSSVSGSVVPILFINNASVGYIADSGKGNWSERLNSFDLKLGYKHFFGKRFSFHPYMGVKGFLLAMEISTHFTNLRSSRIVNLILGNSMSKATSKYWGVGPCVGWDLAFHMNKGISLYSLISLALLYGQFYDISYRGSGSAFPNSDVTLSSRAQFRQQQALQIGLGLSWEHCFSAKYFFQFRIGWECQRFWKASLFPFSYFSINETGNNLTYSGLTTGLRFDF